MICSLDGKTCGACCWSPRLNRAELAEKLRRHSRIFCGTNPSRAVALLWHELRVRRGQDLLLAPLLVVPLARALAAAWLRRRLVCAFAGFLDEEESRVGCLVHPARAPGEDLRVRAAFRLLRGFGCGPPEYLCPGAKKFESANAIAKGHFEIETRGMDWHAYGLAASSFAVEPNRDRMEGSSLCP